MPALLIPARPHAAALPQPMVRANPAARRRSFFLRDGLFARGSFRLGGLGWVGQAAPAVLPKGSRDLKVINIFGFGKGILRGGLNSGKVIVGETI